MIGLILGFLGGLIFLSWGQIGGVDNIKENYPNYKSKDFPSMDQTQK
jgi:hypothetical protein